MVEFALVAPLFFLLVFGITDFGRLFFTQVTLQHALREAGRYAVTGQKKTGTNPDTGNAYTRVESIKQIAAKEAAGLNVSGIHISSVVGGVSSNNFAGGPGSVVVVSLETQLRFITPLIGRFFPGGVYDFTVSTTFKNEPFDFGNTN
jgi:Flp pilus assembly protein TadG